MKQHFFYFREEKAFSEVQKAFMSRFKDEIFNCFVGNHKELRKKSQRSFYSYTNMQVNLRVLTYFFGNTYDVALCIRRDVNYVDGTIIPKNLKIVGVCVSTKFRLNYQNMKDFISFLIKSY